MKGSRMNPTRIASLTAATLLLASTGAFARSTAPDFHWAERIGAKQDVEVDNINGPIDVSRSSSDQVQVTAVRTADESDPNSVQIKVVHDSKGVIICAIYPPDSGEGASDCSRGGGTTRHVHSNSGRNNNDTRVAFTLSLPAGVSGTFHAVNGSIAALGLASPVDAASVNGRVTISTSSYAQARTVNGAIHVSMGDPNWPRNGLSFASVNGPIDVTVPGSASARVHMKTLNGRLTSDFPISRHDGIFGINRSAEGVIGSGRSDLEFNTVNGSITLAKNP